MKKKVLSTVTLYSQRCKSAKELLEKEGFEVIEYQGDTVMTADEIKAVGKDICGAIIGCDEWNEEIFQACPNLKAIGRFGVGYNNIDLEARNVMASRFLLPLVSTPILLLKTLFCWYWRLYAIWSILITLSGGANGYVTAPEELSVIRFTA